MTIALRLCANGHTYPRTLGRCPQCQPRRGTGKARSDQHAFRQRLLASSSHRCMFISDTGVRCAVTEGLEAAHASSYAADGNYNAGTLLCAEHHALLDRR